LLFSDSDCPVDEEFYDFFDIETTENGKYKASLLLPRLEIMALKWISF
jgi:hypothetical protein